MAFGKEYSDNIIAYYDRELYGTNWDDPASVKKTFNNLNSFINDPAFMSMPEWSQRILYKMHKDHFSKK